MLRTQKDRQPRLTFALLCHFGWWRSDSNESTQGGDNSSGASQHALPLQALVDREWTAEIGAEESFSKRR